MSDFYDTMWGRTLDYCLNTGNQGKFGFDGSEMGKVDAICDAHNEQTNLLRRELEQVKAENCRLQETLAEIRVALMHQEP